jgi:hypothetical protein
MSLNRIAPSMRKRRIGCSVTSAASTGAVQRAMKSPAVARTVRYSGRYRPAWRINQMGGGHTASPPIARRRGFDRVPFAGFIGSA